jgi:hypothetical protein
MTDAEWLASEDPAEMIRFVSETAGARKLRLFGCACCRRVWEQMADVRSRAVVESAEAHAEGKITWKELLADYGPAERAYYDAYYRIAGRRASITEDSNPSLLAARTSAAEAACVCAMRHSGTAAGAARLAACAAARNWRAHPCPVERKVQAGLLRDVVGDGVVRRTFAAWRSPDVMELAKAVYECRSEPSGELDVVRLCVLADALEDAGCDTVILAHLRSVGPHVRGCWAVDLALGKG